VHRGYIKLWRRITDSEFWTSEKFSRAQAFVDMIILANHKDTYFRARGQRIAVKRGQLAYSEGTLSDRWRWSRGKVRRFLEELESETEQKIVQHKSNVTTLITIINYDEYQGDGTALGTPNSTANSTANSTHLKNVKNVKEEKGGRARRHTLPHDFILSDSRKEFASKQGLNGNIETVFSQFCDHHSSKGSVMLDWDAAWRTWVRNEIKFSSGRKPVQEDVDAWIKKVSQS
jgi:hypothetical protein